MDKRYFSLKIVEWYEQHHRKLPWRETKDPYKIWLSEVILQQTRVSQGLPYYNQFVEKYPTVTDLARAKENEVLRLWQGLGYYTRARNLHKCAQKVVEDFNSRFPSSFIDLKKLPGIGEYTAAAIASISFQEPVAVVDGNVFRVLSRVFGINKNISSHEGKKFFRELANSLVSENQPDQYNQAIMEFGAVQCTPKQPKCIDCIFQNDCVAYQEDLQQMLPVNVRTKKSKNRYFYYFVLANKEGIAMKKREAGDIWQGLYDFHLVEAKRSKAVMAIMSECSDVKKILKKNDPLHVTKQYKHILSHQNIHAKFIVINDVKGLPRIDGLKFYSKKKIKELPKPILIHRFLSDYNIL